MKTNVKFTLRASLRTPESGKLHLCVTRHRITRTFSTAYSLSPDEWNEKQQKVNILEANSSGRKRKLAAIENKLKKDLELIAKIIEMLESDGDYSSLDVLRCFREQQQGKLFYDYIGKIIERRNGANKFGTAHIYKFAARSFLKFLKGKDICIEKINDSLIKEYERYLLAENKSRNTISCYMRSLRAAYNQAIAEKIFIVKETKAKPFSEVFTGNAKTEKRAISANAISRLAEIELDEEKAPDVNSLSFSRDLFMFCFYTQGMSFADMANLKKENIKDGIIRYKRKKTGQTITIELEDCMREIISRYSGCNSDYIFPVLRKYEDCEEYVKWEKTIAAIAKYNKSLKRLAKVAGIAEHLTSYVARHTAFSYQLQINKLQSQNFRQVTV